MIMNFKKPSLSFKNLKKQLKDAVKQKQRIKWRVVKDFKEALEELKKNENTV